jgi:hypothetical protein
MGLLAAAPFAHRTFATEIRCDFAEDPKWEGVNNTPPPGFGVEKTQDFGFSRTDHAGGEPGEIGGTVWRSVAPATYGKRIAPKTLQDHLKASGTFAVTQSEGGSGVLIGWFNAGSRGWRTPNSMAFRIDGEAGKFRVFFEYGTQHWLTGGGTTFEGRYQETKTPMPLADGRPHTWVLEYDPHGADGAGEMIFTLDRQQFKAPLAEGHREDGALFDRFGIFNQQIAGEGLTVYLDDLVIDGMAQDFSSDPGWEGTGNRVTFKDRVIRPVHDFGWRGTNHTGGGAGEVGGVMWRIESMRPENACYYGRPVGRLTLDHELKASGSVCFSAAAADSALLVGWFNSRTFIGAPPVNFVGILVEGPSRIGHYFRPVYGTSDDVKHIMEEGPVIRPNADPQEWTLHYDPQANDGNGHVTVTLDAETVSIDLPPEARKGNAVFDRFGFVSWHRGGHFVEMYFDDLVFTGAGESSSDEQFGS